MSANGKLYEYDPGKKDEDLKTDLRYVAIR